MGYKEIAVQQLVHVADQLSKCYERIFGYVLSVGVSDKMARHGNAGQPVVGDFAPASKEQLPVFALETCGKSRLVLVKNAIPGGIRYK